MEQLKENKGLLKFHKQDVIKKPGYVSWGATYDCEDKTHQILFVILEDMHPDSPFFGFSAAYKLYCVRHKELSNAFDVEGQWLTYEEAEAACEKECKEIIEDVRRVAENGGC